MPQTLVYLNPTDPFNLYLKVGALAGVFVTCPFVLYQVWMFISPGLYRNEKRYVMPFMVSTVALFLAGGYFRLQAGLSGGAGIPDWVRQAVPADDHDPRVHGPVSDCDPGMGLIFELPILVFFLALMGMVSAGWMWRNVRYSILVIFIIAAILTPTTDILNMCIFAAPMVVLYVLSIGIAWLVHPKQRRARAGRERER